jgi:hypothetical protein
VQMSNHASDFIKKVKSSAGQNDLERAVAMLKRTLLDGLRHGFFEFSVQGETIKGDNRRVLIKSGTSHIYTIRPDDFEAT